MWIDFRRQNLTSNVGPRAERVKLIEFSIYSLHYWKTLTDYLLLRIWQNVKTIISCVLVCILTIQIKEIGHFVVDYTQIL